MSSPEQPKSHESPAYFDELKSYLDFGADDERALRALLPHVRPHFKDISAEFYRRIQLHEGSRQVLRSEQQVMRLRATLERWVERLLEGPWDEEYFRLRERIGQVHVQIRLPEHYMFSAVGVIQGHLLQIAHRHLDSDQSMKAALAIQKITNIDLAIMQQTYHDDYVTSLQRYERQQKDELERRLEKTEALHHAILESTSACIVTLNADLEIVLFNEQAQKLTGMSRSTVLGRTFMETLCHPSDVDLMIDALHEAQDGRTVGPLESRILTADQDTRWMRWHLGPVDIESGTHVCATGIDFTKEHNLAGRTQRAETLAALGTLAAGLAHEIRNPLNAAQLQLMLVDRGLSKVDPAIGGKALKASKLVRGELKRLAGLVEEFLSFARPSNLRVQNVDVSNLCRGIVGLLEADARSCGVLMSHNIEDDIVARIDDKRMTQVLINLIRNGMDAAGSGGKVELRCRRIAQSVILEVFDTGPGLPSDIDIFEPFATSKEGGTGLGLPIVHRIVSDHDGSIEALRESGRTVFRVEVPIDGPDLRF